MEYDTPETVAAKLDTAATVAAMFAHYFRYNHPGDYFDCGLCKGQE